EIFFGTAAAHALSPSVYQQTSSSLVCFLPLFRDRSSGTGGTSFFFCPSLPLPFRVGVPVTSSVLWDFLQQDIEVTVSLAKR
ncbi:unnamed protein product, partial [Callosobruchus maculatus]